MNFKINPGRRWAGATAAVALASFMSAGCEVTNPGPVDDEYIALPASQAGLINGSWERMNRVIGNYAYHTAMAAREVFHGGQTGSYGHGTDGQAGRFGDGEWDVSGPYNESQQARWIAEEAIRQFEKRGDVAADVLTRAYLAAGYANRMNGDFYCHAVIDSGPLEATGGRAYWTRAEGHFTKALTVATDAAQRHAAYAGRAQARLSLGDWAGAITDARLVPNDFAIYVPMDFSAGGLTAQRNHVYWATADSPFRSFSVRFTFYDQYYTDTGDPRTPWRLFPSASAQNCVGALSGFGAVPCTQQRKYTSQDDDIRMASGAEMRLIEAEAMLRQTPGNWQAAMTIINANRTSNISDKTGRALTPWVANNLDDAWTFLMRERGAELWLEARRFADMRRWEPYIRQYGTFAADGQTVLDIPATTPGTLDWPDYESRMLNPTVNIFTTNLRGREAIEDQSRPRELCYNISNTERQNNPNINDQDVQP